MKTLDIELICANTPQAKGRVERVIETLQDRLVKELRLREISTIADANTFVPEYIADFNHRFAVQPRSNHDAHRSQLFSEEELDVIFSRQETRFLSKNLTLQYNNVIYQIQSKRPTYALRNAHVTVCENHQGEITILYKNNPLQFTLFRKQIRQAQTVMTKDIDRHLNNPGKPHKPAADHPWRQYNRRINGRPIRKAPPYGND